MLSLSELNMVQALLDDLRKGSSVDNALGVPAGPNSGLSVHF